MNDIRSRFTELVNHLKQKAIVRGIPAENFEADLESITLVSGGHNETITGRHLANFRYRGVLYIERLPKSEAAVVMMRIRAWLDDHDDTRDKFGLPDPEVSLVSLDDSGLVDMLVTAEFADPVYLSPAADDSPDAEVIEWDGKRWDTAPYDLWIAEYGKVNGAPAND